MRLTVLQGAELTKVPAVINPARIDGARPFEKANGEVLGTILEVGPEEVLVAEDYATVAEALEDAWEDLGMAYTNRLWQPLEPFLQLLPMALPFVLQQVQGFARDHGMPVPGGFGIPRPPMPDGPGPVPVPDPVGFNPESLNPVVAETSNPPRDVVEGEVATVTCRNCRGVFCPSHLCPGCGAVLVGKG